MSECLSRVRCNVCQLWKLVTEIAVVYSSGGLCIKCAEGREGERS
jgi:hypothetical protein